MGRQCTRYERERDEQRCGGGRPGRHSAVQSSRDHRAVCTYVTCRIACSATSNSQYKRNEEVGNFSRHVRIFFLAREARRVGDASLREVTIDQRASKPHVSNRESSCSRWQQSARAPALSSQIHAYVIYVYSRACVRAYVVHTSEHATHEHT